MPRVVRKGGTAGFHNLKDHRKKPHAFSKPSAGTLNMLGEQIARTPITLAKLDFMAEPVEDDAHKAEAIIKIRIIRAGRDAWLKITKSDSFDAWQRIGAALVIGKAHALRVSHANAPWGSAYCKAFSAWAMGFTAIRASDRSWSIALHENIGAITAWRATLSDRQRSRLRSAQANVRRWRLSTGQRPECSGDLKARAAMHWRHFLSAMKQMPAAEREELWHRSLADFASAFASELLKTRQYEAGLRNLFSPENA